MPTVYIAGPMRRRPYLNFPAFDKAEALGRSLGWSIISPAQMDRDAGINENDYPTGHEFESASPALIRQFVQRDVAAILGRLRAEDGDAIAVLPGWETSIGALGEVGLGLWLKLRFLDAETFYPMEAELKGLAFRPPLGMTCEGGVCNGPAFKQWVKETAERIANQE